MVMEIRNKMRGSQSTVLDPAILVPAIWQSFVKLSPRVLIRNPVMFVVEIVAALTTIILAARADLGRRRSASPSRSSSGCGSPCCSPTSPKPWPRAAARRRRRHCARHAPRRRPSGSHRRTRSSYQTVPAPELKQGDIVLVEAGDLIPSDGDVVEGIASVDESAITGESAPVIRESGGDRSAVTGGTRVLSDWIKVRITAAQGSTFLDRMIALVEGAERQKTPNEIALNILLAGLTIIFVFAVATIPSFATYAGGTVSVVILVALFVALIPTTIGALLSAIGIAGMDRLVRFNVLAMSGRAVEAAGDVDTLLLDKTGTITLGNRQATEFLPLSGVSRAGTGRCGTACVAVRRDAGRPLHRRAGEGEIQHPRPRNGADGCALHPVLRADAAVRRRPGWLRHPQGCGGCGAGVRAQSAVADGNGGGVATAVRPTVSEAAVRELTRKSERSPSRAARRSRSARTAACSA